MKIPNIKIEHIRRFNRFMMFCMAALGCMITAVAIPEYEICTIGMLFSYALLLISYHFMIVYSENCYDPPE